MSMGYGQVSITDRMLRAARVESRLYEEVEHDQNATGQAMTVVVVVAVATGIGTALRAILMGDPGAAVGRFGVGLIMALLGWAIWSGLAYFVGTKVFGGVATYGELLRTIGFAQSPGVLNILGFIPFLGPLVSFLVGIWILVTTVVAMRQALDISTGKAILTGLVGFLAYLVLSAILIAPFAARWGSP